MSTKEKRMPRKGRRRMTIAILTAATMTITATPAVAKIKPVAKRAQGTPLAKAS